MNTQPSSPKPALPEALYELCVCGHILNVHPGQYGNCQDCGCGMWRRTGKFTPAEERE